MNEKEREKCIHGWIGRINGGFFRKAFFLANEFIPCKVSYYDLWENTLKQFKCSLKDFLKNHP